MEDYTINEIEQVKEYSFDPTNYELLAQGAEGVRYL